MVATCGLDQRPLGSITSINLSHLADSRQTKSSFGVKYSSLSSINIGCPFGSSYWVTSPVVAFAVRFISFSFN